jgi:hypothetical protein
MEKIFNTIKQKKITDVQFVGIIHAENWFTFPVKYPIGPQDFVVMQWYDHHDGINSHLEGKETIAICKQLKDAERIYKSRKIPE